MTARIGLLLPLVVSCALATSLLHALGPLRGATYSWLRPMGILYSVISLPFGPTWLFGAFLVGVGARPGAIGRLWRRLRSPDPVHLSSRDLGLAATCAVAVLATTTLLFPAHHGFDRAAALATGGWIGLRARSGFLGRIGRALTEMAVVIVAFLLVSYTFTVVKAHLFVLSVPSDELLYGFEERLLGQPVHRLVAEWAALQPGFVLFCDRIYYRIFEHMAVVALFLTGLGRCEIRHRFVTSLCIAYLAGGPAYFILPALGPAFHEPETFGFLRQLPAATNHFQGFLLANTLAAQQGSLQRLPSYEFIAAMPSLHMAHEFVMLHFSRFSRPFFAATLVFTALTTIAVVVLGWHYPIDVPGGFLLAGFAVWTANRGGRCWMPALLRPEASGLGKEAGR